MAEVTEQIVREAPQIEAYKLGLLQAAKSLSEKQLPLPAYQVSGMTDLQKQAAQLAEQGIGGYQPYLQAGQKALEAGIGAVGQSFGAPTTTDLQQFQNPYQQLVTQQALAEMQRQANIAQQGAAAQAVRAGAFGGTREGVQRAETARNLQDIMSQRIAQDLAQNYAQAQNLFSQQQQRAQQAGQLYGQLGVQQAALGQSAQQLGLQDVQTLSTLGQQEQAQEQQVLEAQRATKLQEALTPYQQLSFLSDIYKGAPGTQIALTAQTAPQASPLQQAVGLGIGALSAATGAKKAGLF
ncbi:hypothetical protein [Phage DSL-LC04]|nr:hypothetical protein [Phage DSL-LC04]